MGDHLIARRLRGDSFGEKGTLDLGRSIMGVLNDAEIGLGEAHDAESNLGLHRIAGRNLGVHLNAESNLGEGWGYI